uniref:Trypsin n=1 Tax=Euphausia superba TaxID=6819 RepID=A0A1D8QLQ6_EUPSU|nr:trypsin [Euphausia superba]
MRALLQQLLGLVLVLVAANAQVSEEYFTLKDGTHVQPRAGNWSIEPRASGTYACSRRPRLVTLRAGDVATFTSPGYPSPYTAKQNCGWRFKAPGRTDQITITCSSFALQPSGRRCQDFLAIGSRSLRQKYCGSNGPSSVSVIRYVRLTFRSDRSRNFAGFTCTATLAGTNPVVTSAPVTNPPVTSGRCVCGQANRATRIVGGQTTEVNEYPWQVALVSRGSTQVFCGGSLINDRWVLTAAHCTQSGVQQVILGNHLQSSTDTGERRVNVRRVVDHPNYNSRNLDNDFSLLELSTPQNLENVDPQIRPVCLPSASNPSQYEDVMAIVSGWGTTSAGGSQPNALRDTAVRTQTNAQCNQAYGSGSITNSMICAATSGRDSCQGDSGGPLVRNVGGYFRQIGVVSWGSGCADARFPGVYSRVTNQINWITSTSSSGTTCAPPS